MNSFLDRLEGQTLDGSYVLGTCLASGEHTAVYAIESGGEEPAVVKIVFAEEQESNLHLLHWAVASQLSHLHLVRIYKTGRAEIDGARVAYVVMERVDETLAGVLAERPLSEDEAREMLTPALAALGYLHDRGFSHGAIRPSNVMAAGETLKLSIDSVVRTGEPRLQPKASPFDAPETRGGVPSAAGDVWSLGALLIQALTLQGPASREGEASALPEPFATLVPHCMADNPARRWSIAEIAAAAEGRAFEPPPEPPKRELASRPAPVLIPTEPKAQRPQWLIPAVAIAALALLLVIVAALKSAGPGAAPAPKALTPAVSVPQPRQQPPPGNPVVPSAAPAPPKHRSGTGAWYVVVATYASKDGAEKRAREISNKWPRFRAHVFEPPVRDPHHLVVIGSNLSEDEADSLRKRARASGLPRDVYIKKFGR